MAGSHFLVGDFDCQSGVIFLCFTPHSFMYSAHLVPLKGGPLSDFTTSGYPNKEKSGVFIYYYHQIILEDLTHVMVRQCLYWCWPDRGYTVSLPFLLLCPYQETRPNFTNRISFYGPLGVLHGLSSILIVRDFSETQVCRFLSPCLRNRSQ